LVGWRPPPPETTSKIKGREGARTKCVLWFGLAGVCNGAAVLAMYAALTHGPVTLVAPAIAAHPLFTLVFGASLRPQERPTPRELLRETWIFRYKERFHSAVIAKLR
jgi:drug/metabolite transporter (DMT)-like permease